MELKLQLQIIKKENLIVDEYMMNIKTTTDSLGTIREPI